MAVRSHPILRSIFYILAVALITFSTPSITVVQSILLFVCLLMIGLAASSRGSRHSCDCS
ncbi:MAG: hypothetical protein IT430_08280 [Phycisphaerales bacterium]|nr:hypothetical protein [Phycisphaerales bacterium]